MLLIYLFHVFLFQFQYTSNIMYLVRNIFLVIPVDKLLDFNGYICIFYEVVTLGIEPGKQGFSVLCSSSASKSERQRAFGCNQLSYGTL